MRAINTGEASAYHIHLTETWGAHNYHPLPVVAASAKGVWITDVEGKKYLDLLSAYSALNWGHSPERFLKVAHEQLDKLTLTGRAYMNDKLGVFCKELAELCGKDTVLPMTTGAEAVETAIKAARRWGYEKKKVAEGCAEIITFSRNFAGRTTTIVSFSDSHESKSGFGPYTEGFKIVPFGDFEAVVSAMNANTVAVLVEPIQGEGGVNIPPKGFLKNLREECSKRNVLLIADEIQTGFCRTGEVFACSLDGVIPDLYILGKALGAGITPISAVVGNKEIMDVFRPGSHGSTYGGNPLACAIAIEVIRFIKETSPQKHAKDLGEWFMHELTSLNLEKIKEIRGKGLLIGIEIKSEFGKAYPFCEELAKRGVLTKDTRSSTMRVAPPLTITKEELQFGLDQIKDVLS